MQLLLLIVLASAQIFTSNAECSILPITPTVSNGLTPCGYGGLIAGCFCCHGQTACQSLIQDCTLGLGNNYICVNNPQYTPSCASQGLANCGTGCMPSAATCCSGQTYCQAGYRCGTGSNCIPDSLSSSGSSSPSKATAPALSPSTPKTTAPTSTSTSHSQSSSSVATRKRYGRISSLVIVIALNVFVFCWL